jgi:hypothetical protein
VFGAGFDHLSVGDLRQLILQRWRGVLSAEEERFIRTSSERGKIEFRYAAMQRVRFLVGERFAGPAIKEVYTDASSCGYRFELNRDYLVNSVLDGPRCSTSACSRTSDIESDSAVEDLKALRAWKSGAPLQPRIYGHIYSEDLRPNIRVYLMQGGRETKSARLSAGGGFSFDGLDRAEYRLQIRDERGSGERVIDLSRPGCFEATPWFDRDGTWRIAGLPVPVVLAPRPVPRVPDPPPLPPPPPQYPSGMPPFLALPPL